MAFFVRLSLAMGVPMSELRVSADELAIYLAFESRYGILGPQRQDLQNGNIVATLCNLYRKKGTSAIKPTEAMLPQWDELTEYSADAPQSISELERNLRRLMLSPHQK